MQFNNSNRFPVDFPGTSLSLVPQTASPFRCGSASPGAAAAARGEGAAAGGRTPGKGGAAGEVRGQGRPRDDAGRRGGHGMGETWEGHGRPVG